MHLSTLVANCFCRPCYESEAKAFVYDSFAYLRQDAQENNLGVGIDSLVILLLALNKSTGRVISTLVYSLITASVLARIFAPAYILQVFRYC